MPKIPDELLVDGWRPPDPVADYYVEPTAEETIRFQQQQIEHLVGPRARDRWTADPSFARAELRQRALARATYAARAASQKEAAREGTRCAVCGKPGGSSRLGPTRATVLGPARIAGVTPMHDSCRQAAEWEAFQRAIEPHLEDARRYLDDQEKP